MPHKPSWFRDDEVFVSFADTCGINKDGNVLYVIDSLTGKRTETINDRLMEDIDALVAGRPAVTGRWVHRDHLSIGAPRYYDTRFVAALDDLLKQPAFRGFTARTIGELVDEGFLAKRAGHGSPSADKRGGPVPYIKVSDIRAGQVNINPSNMVSGIVAQSFWRGPHSGLKPFDLVTPIRASKNIGEFAVLMPGQEDVVLTKEMLVLRTTSTAPVDNFFLLWALSLKIVRQQWNRIVLMQTNREDVGDRYLEIEIPWTSDEDAARRVSAPFRNYYLGMDELRRAFTSALAQDDLHHVFLGIDESQDETDQ